MSGGKCQIKQQREKHLKRDENLSNDDDDDDKTGSNDDDDCQD